MPNDEWAAVLSLAQLPRSCLRSRDCARLATVVPSILARAASWKNLEETPSNVASGSSR